MSQKEADGPSPCFIQPAGSGPGGFCDPTMNLTCMNTTAARLPYSTLVSLVDQMLEDCEDDVECLVVRLGGLAPEVQRELLVSDLLNAYQVFFFFFRNGAGELLREQLELEPASALVGGITLGATDFLEMVFLIRDTKPVITINNGEKNVATFSGTTAYENGLQFLKNPEYQ